MSDIIQKVGIGSGEYVYAAGDFVHVRSCTAPFHLEISTKNGDSVEVHVFESDVGDQFKPKGGFIGLRIINDKSGAVLDVELVIGSGDFSRGSQVVSSINNILNPVIIEKINQPIEVNTKIRDSFFQLATASSVLNTIVLPAANVNGIILNSAVGKVNAGTILTLIASKTTPLWYLSGVICFMAAGSDAVNSFSFPALIPAGYGLYAQASNSSNIRILNVNYEVL